jgi:formyltetrahydrofolate deformylase
MAFGRGRRFRMSERARSGILTLECPERVGVVAAVASRLAELRLTIGEANQFNDAITQTFYMRAAFTSVSDLHVDLAAVKSALAPVAEKFAMTWDIVDGDYRPRVLIGVSKFGHCLFDLIHRWRTGILPVEIVGVFSNHLDMADFVGWNGVPYHHLPVKPETKADQENRILALVGETRADLVVLARYMQVLSNDLCAALSGRCINIHHSFLPSFKGARPYHQAHARGVKIIGATAHYVTTNLDEGPIIEQGVERVDHSKSPKDLVEVGRDIEAVVLARAVKWHAQRRVMLSGARTVVFG